MKLRTKIIIIISLVSILIFAALQVVTVLVIQPSFTSIENDEIQKSTTQVLSTLSYRISNLQGQLRDYSCWNDTYNFVQNRNQEFVENNFVDSTFINLNLNLIAVVDNNRSIVYCKSFDLNNSAEMQTSEETRMTLTSDEEIWTCLSTENAVSGIMLIDNQPMYVVTAPILTSLSQGPIMGGLLFGRYIGGQEISELTEITNLNFSIKNF